MWGKRKVQETAECTDNFLIQDAWLALAIEDVLFLRPVQKVIAREHGQAMPEYSTAQVFLAAASGLREEWASGWRFAEASSKT